MPKDTKKPNIHAGHRERMRARYTTRGFDAFSDHECLEYMLFNVIRRGNTNFIAHDLIDRFGSLEGVLNAPREELMTIKGVGEKMAEYIISLGSSIIATVVKYYAERGFESEYDVSLLCDVVMRFSKDASVCAVMISREGRLYGIAHGRGEKATEEILRLVRSNPVHRCVLVYASKEEYISYHKVSLEEEMKNAGVTEISVRLRDASAVK